MNIDINKIEAVRNAYLSVGNMIKLTTDTQLDDVDGKELNLSYFSSLLALLNAEFCRVVWENFDLRRAFQQAQAEERSESRPA